MAKSEVRRSVENRDSVRQHFLTSLTLHWIAHKNPLRSFLLPFLPNLISSTSTKRLQALKGQISNSNSNESMSSSQSSNLQGNGTLGSIFELECSSQSYDWGIKANQGSLVAKFVGKQDKGDEKFAEVSLSLSGWALFHDRRIQIRLSECMCKQ